MEELAKKVKETSYKLSTLSSDQKDQILELIHSEIKESKEEILAKNRLDLETQKDSISPQLYKRLDMGAKFDDLLAGILDVRKLPDPNSNLGLITEKIQLATELSPGLELFRVSCPVGALLIIFEARPEVVVQISSLSIKSGNAVILKGGKEALNSNLILFEAIQRAIGKVDLTLVNAVQLVRDRSDISELLNLDRYIDLVIPRGSNDLVRYVQQNTRIPVLGHADGICSTFVDEFADIEKAVKVVVDGKVNYPAACNSTEKLLIHSKVLGSHLPIICDALKSKNVTLKADERALTVISSCDNVVNAVENDFETEFLDLVLAVKTVDTLEEAIEHINIHGSHHTDCIVTEDESRARTFMDSVDSAGVFWNASTRFADGFRYGFGAEIGVSTNKTHARGPVGLEGLMIYKYRLYGNGHCVGEFSNGNRTYSHKPISLEQRKL